MVGVGGETTLPPRLHPLPYRPVGSFLERGGFCRVDRLRSVAIGGGGDLPLPLPPIPLHHRLGVERHGFERVDGNDDGSSGGVDLVWLMEDETCFDASSRMEIYITHISKKELNTSGGQSEFDEF